MAGHAKTVADAGAVLFKQRRCKTLAHALQQSAVRCHRALRCVSACIKDERRACHRKTR